MLVVNPTGGWAVRLNPLPPQLEVADPPGPGDDDEVEDAQDLWHAQVDKLRRVLGC